MRPLGKEIRKEPKYQGEIDGFHGPVLFTISQSGAALAIIAKILGAVGVGPAAIIAVPDPG
jgi:hypothetical protein